MPSRYHGRFVSHDWHLMLSEQTEDVSSFALAAKVIKKMLCGTVILDLSAKSRMVKKSRFGTQEINMKLINFCLKLSLLVDICYSDAFCCKNIYICLERGTKLYLTKVKGIYSIST